MKFSKKEIISIIVSSAIIGAIVGIVFGFAIGKRVEYDNLKTEIEIVGIYDNPEHHDIVNVDINWSPIEMTDDGHFTDSDIETYEYYK